MKSIDMFDDRNHLSRPLTADYDKAWIRTFSGLKFYHLNPQPEMVVIEDIAHALSMICRWSGHTRDHYSVAQHSYYASYVCDQSKPTLKLACLMHDSPEAYIGDMNRPLKHFTPAGVAYRKIEARVEEVIFKKFGVPFPLPPEVKDADNKMLYAERAQVIPDSTCEQWTMDEAEAAIIIERWTPRRAEKMFLKRFKELYKGE